MDITRRDFLDGILLGSGPGLLRAQPPARRSWDGPGGVGDYAACNGNPWRVIEAAHRVREGAYEAEILPSRDTGEAFDLVVVGAGMSGLGAALYFRKYFPSGRTCLVLDNHPVFGRWVRDFWESGPAPDALRKWKFDRRRYYQKEDFASWLDTMTYQDYIEKVMGLPHEVTEYAHPILAAGLARYIVKTLAPESLTGSHELNDIITGRVRFDRLDRPGMPFRFRLGATVVRAVEQLREYL
jgi:hypothetical protein